MSHLAHIAVPVAAAAIAVGGCGNHPGVGPTVPGPVPIVVVPAPTVTTSRSIPVPAPPWRPPAAAIAVAERYATAALSSTWSQPPGAWIARVAPICTPQWAAALRRDADGGYGGWAAIVAGHASAAARVLAVYPSAGPGPGQRLDVTARITRTSPAGMSVSPAALVVDLLAQPDGAWRIGWAG